MELHGVLFREGDKVMQMKNNYQIKWEIRGYNHMMIEEGSGVFNGDMRNRHWRSMTFSGDGDGAYLMRAEWWHLSAGKLLDELELAYAITIHKSQGSEYPAVVIAAFVRTVDRL